MSGNSKSSSSEQQRATRLQVSVTLSEAPAHSRFTRKLRFEHENGEHIFVPLAFRKQSGLIWRFDTAHGYLSSEEDVRDAAGMALHQLGRLVDLGNRSFWDKMTLVNTGGSTELKIERLWVALSYGGIGYHLPRWINDKTFTIVNTDLNATLRSGRSEISLDNAARESRRSFSQVPDSFPRALKLCAEDLGKSGSDSKDRYSPNAKYGGRLNLLCSEFASWYYAHCGIRIGGDSLRDIVGTDKMHEIFQDAGKLHYYHNGRKRVFKTGSSTNEYVPRPGDYLERRGPKGAEHSMIILRWLPGNPISSHEEERESRAWVFNGPWPVAIREVRIHVDETDKDKDYFIGRI